MGIRASFPYKFYFLYFIRISIHLLGKRYMPCGERVIVDVVVSVWLQRTKSFDEYDLTALKIDECFFRWKFRFSAPATRYRSPFFFQYYRQVRRRCEKSALETRVVDFNFYFYLFLLF